MKLKKPKKPEKVKRASNRYVLQKPPFDAFDPEGSIKDQLGSNRSRQRREVSDQRSANYRPEQSGWKLGSQDSSFPLIITGTAAPTSTPAKRGDIFINKTLAKVYISTGISSSADWTLIN